MIIVNMPTRFIGAAAVTVFPFIFIDPLYEPWIDKILVHEGIHYEQQKKWFKYGLGIGLFIWFFLYLFCFPFLWNPFRRKWETEACKAEGYSEEIINEFLKEKPYFLRW